MKDESYKKNFSIWSNGLGFVEGQSFDLWGNVQTPILL